MTNYILIPPSIAVRKRGLRAWVCRTLGALLRSDRLWDAGMETVDGPSLTRRILETCQHARAVKGASDGNC